MLSLLLLLLLSRRTIIIICLWWLLIITTITTTSWSTTTTVATALVQPPPFVTTDIPPLIDVPVWSMATLNTFDDDDDGDDDDVGDDNDDTQTTTTTTAATTTTTNMNLLTYATPVSIKPYRLWAIGLYKQTLTYKNFIRNKCCIMQLLTKKHIPIIKVLGGKSGSDIDKELAITNIDSSLRPERMVCDESRQEEDDLDSDAKNEEDDRFANIKVLPGCSYYLKLTVMGDDMLIDGGESHDIAICKVEEMLVVKNPSSKDEGTSNDSERQHQQQQQPEQQHLTTAKLRQLGVITEQGRIKLPNRKENERNETKE